MSISNSIPARMKAVFLEKPNGPLLVKETDIIQPKPGEVLIKIAAAPVNPSDLAGIKNAHSEYDFSTFIPGLEGSGKVVRAGRGLLPSLWNGKRVACSTKYNTSGTWAEYMVTDAASCFPLNKKISDEQGSMMLVNPLTALAFLDIVKKEGHRAAINNAAASALGRMVELLCMQHGIPLINIVRKREQAEMLKSQGSEYVLNCSDPSFSENLRSLASDLKSTILFDSVCGPGFHELIEALPSGSSVKIYGSLSPDDHVLINPRKLLANDIHISGFYLGAQAKKNGLLKNFTNLRKVSRLMSTEMKIKIQRTFPLEKAQEAVDTYLSDMTAGKVLLIP